MPIPKLVAFSDAQTALADARFDAVVLVSPGTATAIPALDAVLAHAREVDARVGQDVLLLHASGLPGRRLVFSPTGPLTRDYDDVRRVGDAARAGVCRARDAGARSPLLLVCGVPATGRYTARDQVAALGALGGLWAPLEAREARGESTVEPVASLGLVGPDAVEMARVVGAIELGRRLSRDLGGTEPERMRPEAFAATCVDAFLDTTVAVQVIEEHDTLCYQFPLLMAVARASWAVERHRPRVVHLEYVGAGPIERTILLAGKGLTYDTGGADLKVGGSMAGMSRDKGGAAAVAGLLRTVAALKPRGVRVIGLLGVLRNSAGADAYVADEILVSHAGVRVRVGNTDAEGRLVLADLLSHLRVSALEAVNPHVLSVATLTGHAGRAMGPYSILIENGAARDRRVAATLDALGERWGDVFETSTLRREDYDFVKPRSAADDVLSSNNLPSVGTPRGHQYPAAFLTVASGLDQHGADARTPMPFTHIDLGGSATEGGDWQHGRPTAASVTALGVWAAGL